MPSASLPPCSTRLDIYDALVDFKPSTRTYQAAHATATRLCGTCTSLCDDRITPGRRPRAAADFDATQWVPKPAPILLPPGAQPPRNRDAWARMVDALARKGLTPSFIAAVLSVSERTVTELLAVAADGRAA